MMLTGEVDPKLWQVSMLHEVIQDIIPRCQNTMNFSVCRGQISMSKLSDLSHILYPHFWQGYGGGDEVNMLQRHLHGTPTKVGVGANRAAVAFEFIQKYGYVDTRQSLWYDKLCLDWKVPGCLEPEKVGVVVLDDAMQVK